MNIQGPPVHYPNSHSSTQSVWRTTPTRQGTPPAYGDEGAAPPRYQEDYAEGGKDAPPGKRTLVIRLATSVFIMLIVALIVAAVFGRIDEVKADEEH